MTTGTRTLLATGAMLIGVAAAAAQAPGPRRAVLVTEGVPAPFAGPARSPAAVIDRLVSFDVDADRRLSGEELPERMQGLVARGDRNADAVLDADEIRILVHAASSRPVPVTPGLPASQGLAGVVDDLRLAPFKHARARLIVDSRKPPRRANDPESAALLEEMKALLDPEEYEDFLAAAIRLTRTDLRFRVISGVVGGVVVPAPPK